jgi:hypothetical protein
MDHVPLSLSLSKGRFFFLLNCKPQVKRPFDMLREGVLSLAASMLLILPTAARDSLGIYDGWGAFRDAAPLKCYAIAEPEGGGGAKWRPFASLSWWPNDAVRGQLHIRLSRQIREGANVMLVAGGRTWRLKAGKFDAWAPSARHDAFIIAKLRSAPSFSVSSVAATGGGFADTYLLKGAASAFDAAALGCAKSQ